MSERVTYDHKGRLDEVVTEGGAHLERIGKRCWFLECTRADGSSICLYIAGRVVGMGQRPAPERSAE